MILLHLETGFLKGSSGCLDLGHRYENIFGIILHPCGEALNLVGITHVTFQSGSKNHPYDVIKMRDVRQVGKETPKKIYIISHFYDVSLFMKDLIYWSARSSSWIVGYGKEVEERELCYSSKLRASLHQRR